MGQRKKRVINRRRQEEKEEVPVIPNWSELCPDLLRFVFKRLNYIDFILAKSVSSSWHTASRGCVPKQIPWLILLPSKEEGNNNNNNKSRCVLFVPEDKDKVYKTRDLGVDFLQSYCLATYGSWLLMLNHLYNKLYILNPLTCERIDLPDTISIFHRSMEVCFWIDNRTKDYLVVLTTFDGTMFIKKGVNKWHKLTEFKRYNGIVYNHKNQKLYILYHDGPLMIWDFSRDKPRKDGFLDFSRLSYYDLLHGRNLVEIKRSHAVTISGDVLMVSSYFRVQDCKTCYFGIYKADYVKREWVKIDSLGDEALILDMGVTVVAKDVSGMKRNSIYFSGFSYCRKDPNRIFVFDLTTQKIEHLPQCVSSSIQFSDARWFFPGFNG